MRTSSVLMCVAAGAALAWAPAAAAGAPANACVTLQTAGGRYVAAAGAAYAATAQRGGALRFHLKPTSLHAYLLSGGDGGLMAEAEGGSVERTSSPGAAAEWALVRRGRGWAIRAAASRRLLAVDRASRAIVTVPAGGARFRLRRVSSCRRYPEATLGARGKRFHGRVWGFADAHLHVTANLRAGGLVMAGTPFHRYGAPEALGHDADVHGEQGSLDITGNLLRSGNPVGTHDTAGWPTFTGWPARDGFTHEQVYHRWLQRAWMGGLRLAVAQTVEDEPLCDLQPRRSHPCDETATVELQVAQLRALERYVDAQSGGRGRGWFRLVYGPRQAQRVIERGRLAVVIGAEMSNPFGCSQVRGTPRCDRAGIDRGIARLRRLGVRSMFLTHWVDNALGGAALEGGDKGVFIGLMQTRHTGAPFRTGACPEPGQGEEVEPAAPDVLTPVLGPIAGRSPEPLPVRTAGRQCNTRGLTDLGEYAVRRLMDEHMLIEVDHLGEWGRRRLLEIARRRDYPLVSSHTHTGGSWTASELRRLYALGGFATATLAEASKLPGKILALREHQGRHHAGVGLSSDAGGFAELPGPEASRPPLRYPFRSFDGRVLFGRERTGERIFDFNRDGVAHYGLLPDLLAQARREKHGRRALNALFRSAGAYLDTWRRTGRR